MEQLDVKPYGNPDTKCLVCHRELVLRHPTEHEKAFQAAEINRKWNKGILPRDVVALSNKCVCGQGEQVFYKNLKEECLDLI